MSLKLTLLAAAVVLMALLSAATALFWFGYRTGSSAVQSRWNESVQNLKDLADKDLKADRDAGYKLALDLQHQLIAMELKYDNVSSQYEQSLSKQVVCPKSGKIGDVMLPSELVDSLFISSKRVAPTPGPAASGANSRMR